MKGKRLLALLLAVCFVFTVTGCGSEKKSKDTEATEKTEKTEATESTESSAWKQVQKSGKLTIGFCVKEPMNYIDSDDNLAGLWEKIFD